MTFRFIALLVLFVSFAAYAGQTGQQLRIREQRDMRFATITPDPAGDIVVLSPQGTLSSSNTSLFSGSPRAAEFRARGERNRAVSISFSTGDSLAGPGSSMPLGSFTHDLGPTPQFPNNGQLRFNVGASLSISSGQFGGAYSGSYTIFIDYQ